VIISRFGAQIWFVLVRSSDVPLRWKVFEGSLILILPLLFMLTVGQAFAQDTMAKFSEPRQEKLGWSGSVSLSLSSLTGNTNIRLAETSLNADYNKNHNPEQPFRHTITASVNVGDSAEERGGKRFKMRDQKNAGYKADYFLTEKSTPRAFVYYDSDSFAALDFRIMAGVGYGYEFLKTNRHVVSVGGGISYLDLQYSDATPGISGIAGRVSLDYGGQFTANISLKQKLVLVVTDGLTVKKSSTSFEYALSERSSVALNNEINHSSVIPAAAIARTDSNTNLSLLIKF